MPPTPTTELPPVPLLITPTVHDRAGYEGIAGFDVDPATMNQVYDDVRRPDLQEGSALTMGISRPFGAGGDKPADATIDGRFTGGPPGTGRPGNKGDVDKDHTVHIQLDQDERISEAAIAEKITETLLVPARMRRTIENSIGAVAAASGVLAETTAYVIYNTNNGDPTPGTWAWMVGGGLALAGAAVEFGRGVMQGRRINASRAAAVVRRPVHIKRY